VNAAEAAQLTGCSISELAPRIESGEVSPVDVVDATLHRIDAVDPGLNSYIRVAADSARLQAKAAERSIAAGEYLGALHGIPIGLKDLVAERGEVCSAGSKILADFVPVEDATLAARLRAAGAIFTGRLNMHEFAYGVTSDNPHYGAVHNPWDTDRSPGGSSGGSGAAVAARLCHGAVGTDTGCSIRLPAAFNGIAGIRPTIGRVSNHGVNPLAWTLDTAGPMCRTVEDCGLMLARMSGYDSRDPQTANIPVPDYEQDLQRDLQGIRLALIEDFSLSGLHKDVEAAMRTALKVLDDAGADVFEVRVDDLEPSVSALLTVDIVEPSAYHAQWIRERPRDYGQDVRALLEVGELYLATHYVQAQRYRAVLSDRFNEVLQNADAIVTPTVPFTAPPVGATEVKLEDGETLDIITAVMRYNALAPLTGMPALSVPCGFADDGLPVGMQLIGRAFEEATVLRIGHCYQQLTTWHERAPRL